MSLEPNFTPEQHNYQQSSTFNANSAILGVSSLIIIAALGLVWTTTQSTATGVTKLETTIPYITQSVDRMQIQISGMVTRAELDSRIKEADDNNRALIKQLMERKQ